MNELTGNRREDFANFNFIRLLAASSVIFSHAFLISDGSEAHEPLVLLLGGHNIIGLYGVHIFFIISGFLVTQSFAGAGSSLHFIWRRFLRIYPALFVCLLICGLVLGAVFSNLGAAGYLLGLNGPRYVLGNLLWPGDPWDIPSVEFYPGAIGQIANGSLW